MTENEPTLRVQLKITGRVQGVYYRADTVQQAQSLGLTGWVMNCSDGSVEAVAEGTKPKLEELIAWCQRGPRGARVARVEVSWQIAQNAFRGFTIRHE
jgi:acylphosphatase